MSSDAHNGKVIIFSAPSGAGKTTITRHVLTSFPQLEFSVSATTRAPRGKEKNGTDYYFISRDEFEQRIKADDFVEWEEVYSGNYYGTLKSEVERIWASGKHVVFDVDVKGGIHLKKIYGSRALSVFIMPPSIAELEKRLFARGTESDEAIHTRVNKAFSEIDYYRDFDKIIVNEKLDKALHDAEMIISSFLDQS